MGLLVHEGAAVLCWLGVVQSQGAVWNSVASWASYWTRSQKPKATRRRRVGVDEKQIVVDGEKK